MTRGFHSSLAASLSATEIDLILFLDVATGTSPATLRFTTNATDMTYPVPGGSTYFSRPFDMGDIQIEGGETPSVQIILADVDSYMDTWLLTSDFRYQKVVRRIAVREHTTLVSSTTDTLRITNHDREGHNFVFTAEPLLGILGRINLPARIMTRADFPGMPREGVVR